MDDGRDTEADGPKPMDATPLDLPVARSVKMKQSETAPHCANSFRRVASVVSKLSPCTLTLLNPGKLCCFSPLLHATGGERRGMNRVGENKTMCDVGSQDQMH